MCDRAFEGGGDGEVDLVVEPVPCCGGREDVEEITDDRRLEERRVLAQINLVFHAAASFPDIFGHIFSFGVKVGTAAKKIIKLLPR